MRTDRKKPRNDLRNYYTLFLEGGLIVVLLFATAVMKVDFISGQSEVDLTQEQEVVQMEEIVQTEQVEKPPPPPPPKVPVEVPNDEVIEDEILNIDAELDLDREMEMPPPPDDEEEEEENFFLVVEQDPELKGGLKKLQDCVKYPEMARQAGIEGRVTIQFIVNEQGRVEDPRVLRGIGAGADEEALRCVRQAEFVPGRQRGKAVRVQFSLPVFFRLQN